MAADPKDGYADLMRLCPQPPPFPVISEASRLKNDSDVDHGNETGSYYGDFLSNSLYRFRFASRHALHLTLIQLWVLPERYGADPRLLTMPSSPRSSQATKSRSASSKVSESRIGPPCSIF